ncbi:hypothetical protein STRMA_1119 [Streptococcus macacae NCTC 11558]|uniref:Uncharacterized protein n=1 Tax=Streptococcus macacae NCTC 11558 TaxID=764298 RepID=G5JVV1_9STRE|nr:hypothetical protein STRMA_1119 [Streptococcus macacae NCTC 11558]
MTLKSCYFITLFYVIMKGLTEVLFICTGVIKNEINIT